MRLFLCGGGARPTTDAALAKLNEIIDHTKPILYVPLAMESSRYASCYDWITKELENVDVPGIEMVISISELALSNLENYSALFIGGGNTYKLLSELKGSEAYSNIRKYIDNDGIVFGGSAGAIIFGYDIDTCKYMDRNDVELRYTNGYNTINNVSIFCHFTNESEENTEISYNHLMEYSRKNPVIALPEEDTMFVDNGTFEIIGDRPYFYFEAGTMVTFDTKEKRREAFDAITSPEELLEFMNGNIAYGWIDKDGNKHLNNLKRFRETYFTGTIDEMLDNGLAICIGQAKMIKEVLDKLGYETKLFCSRRYETDNDFDKDVKMHCFVLYRDGDSWYHLEHSNIPRRGIHRYDSVDEAIEAEINKLDQDDVREIAEIVEIPNHLTFREFNEYVNQFSNKKLVR